MKYQEEKKEESSYPFIVFKIHNGLYCVNSNNVSTILQLPEYQAVPDAPPNITGVFSHRQEIIEMCDVRTAFGIPSLNEEYDKFAQMLEDRKQDHIKWVAELERTLKENEPFTLATDPHQCAFGKWYDHYHAESLIIAHHLQKIEEPHRKLHLAADKAEHCNKQCASCPREKCLKDVLKSVREESMPTILRLLDEAKELFRATAYHEMVLVLSGESKIGLVVDEVLSVENLETNEDGKNISIFQGSQLLAGIHRSEKTKELIMELNLPGLLRASSRASI